MCRAPDRDLARTFPPIKCNELAASRRIHNPRTQAGRGLFTEIIDTMAKGPYSRIVIKRPNGRTEIIGRSGHLEPGKASRELAPFGEVIAIRHEQADGTTRPATIAIHDLSPRPPRPPP